MILVPHKSETLVLPITAPEVVSRLSRTTQPAQLTKESRAASDILFNGRVGATSFRISRKVDYPQNYLPLMKGTIESSSRGCILFLKYKLFFSSLTFFTFWTIMSILIGVFFILAHQEYLYAVVSFSAGGVNYVITILNFKKQVNLSRKALNTALNITS